MENEGIRKPSGPSKSNIRSTMDYRWCEDYWKERNFLDAVIWKPPNLRGRRWDFCRSIGGAGSCWLAIRFGFSNPMGSKYIENPQKSWMEHLFISLPITFFFSSIPGNATWQNDFKSSTAQIPERVFDADLLIWDPFCRRAGLRTTSVDKWKIKRW